MVSFLIIILNNAIAIEYLMSTNYQSSPPYGQQPSYQMGQYSQGQYGQGQEMSIWPQLEQLKQAINAAIQQGKLLFTDAMKFIKPLEDAASGTLPKEQLAQYIDLLERAQSGQQISQQELEEMGVVSWLKKIYPPDLFNAMLSTLR
jgi:hypothetical protein